MLTEYLRDPDLTLYVGEALDVLRQLPDESVHCAVTSPPYWGLRDYGTATWEGGDPEHEHVGKEWRTRPAGSEVQAQNRGALAVRSGDCACGARRIDSQLGLEPTPGEFIVRLVGIMRELRRVLRSDGTLWLNLGDTYASRPAGNSTPSGFQQSDNAAAAAARAQLDLEGPAQAWAPPPGLKHKDLCLIPERVAIALQDDGWWLRADVIWSKPHSMPESVTDRPTLTHEHVFLLSKRPRYFYDLEAIREPAKLNGNGVVAGPELDGSEHERDDPRGANARSVWEIGLQPTPEAHFATYPRALVRRCILAGTSERGCCPGCGAQWVRLLEPATPLEGEPIPGAPASSTRRRPVGGQKEWDARKPARELGWAPGCDCDAGDPVPSIVLDPFMGSGTTALVAREHGRRSVGIELNPEYAEMIARRTSQQSLLTETYS